MELINGFGAGLGHCVEVVFGNGAGGGDRLTNVDGNFNGAGEFAIFLKNFVCAINAHGDQGHLGFGGN